jgi:hypothetical protein
MFLKIGASRQTSVLSGRALLYQRTQDNIEYIKDQGYDVVEMWECQWRASIKRDPELSRLLQSFLLQPIDGHVFIPSGCFPPEACFIFSENEMSGRHVLHD